MSAFTEAYDPAAPEPDKVALWAAHARPSQADLHPDERDPDDTQENA